MVASPLKLKPPGKEQLVPDFGIKINGQKLSTEVVAVTVNEEIGVAAMFTLKLADWDAKKRDWIHAALLSLGSEVAISMGYKGQKQELLVGEITALEPEFSNSAVPMLVVRGYDYSHRLLRDRKTRSFTKTTANAIAQQLVQGTGKLQFMGEATNVRLDYWLQHDQSDWECLQQLAQYVGYEVLVKAKTLRLQPRKNQDPPTLTLALQQDLLTFYPRLTSANLVGQVEVHGWDPKTKQAVVGRSRGTAPMGNQLGPRAADNAFGESTLVLQGATQKAAADQRAQGEFEARALAYIHGEGECVGRTDLRAGQVITLKGLGKQFSGAYYLQATCHRYAPQRGYRTTFNVRRNAT